ncbi:MAG: family 20 glycosylhydrolase [Clostridia bacterium]|nr:family 20 glycosylhydrolase [Clostridia bacterium]
MKIGSFLDNQLSKEIKYTYRLRGTEIPYYPDVAKEEECHDFYTAQNGNLFYGREVSWKDSVILQNGVDIFFALDGKSFVDHIDLCQGVGSAIESVEVFTNQGGKSKKIGGYKPEFGKMITASDFTVPVGYYCDNVTVRINADCMPVVIKKLDVWGAWDMENTVYPTPANAEFKGCCFNLDELKTIKAVGDDEKFAAEYLNEKLEELTGHRLTIVETDGDLTLNIGCVGKKDSYILNTEKGNSSIIASNRISLLYGVEAFLQLINEGRVKCCRIEDEAFMDFRGFHFALPSRNKMEFFKSIVKNVLIPMRYNTVIVQVSAAMRYDNFPEINDAWLHAIDMHEKGEWPTPAHYKFVGVDVLEKSEVRDLCDYMESFGLEVIPEVQSYSHSYYITMAYPELGEKIAVPKGQGDIDQNVEDEQPDEFYTATICPSHPDYYKVVFGLIDEVLEVFKPKRYVHMGHDEILHVGKCSKCSKIPCGDLLADEINKLNDYIKTKNLKMAIWGDMFQNMEYSVPTAINKIPKDILMMDFVWYFHLDDDIEDNLLEHGFEVVMGNMYSSHYPRFESRAHKSGMIGAEVSTWIECDEVVYGYYGKFYDLIFSAEGMWNTDYNSKYRLTYNEVVKPIIKNLRLTLGNLKFDGEEKNISLKGSMDNIPYDIRGIAPYNNALVTGPYNPTEEVDVNEFATIVSFVHATSTSSKRIMWQKPEKIGEYVICYDDGSVYTENILYATNIHKYRSTYGDIIKSPMFRHQGYVGTYLAEPECGKTYDGADYTLGKYSIRNPYPEKKVQSIKVNHCGNTGAEIILFGISIKN